MVEVMSKDERQLLSPMSRESSAAGVGRASIVTP
jgi:hypothetical protein